MGGDLAPGSTLPSASIMAQEYKLSRPALREAIKLLAGKGLVSAAPRRGTIIRPRSEWNRLDFDLLAWEAEEAPTPNFIRDLFELRRMVEPEAAALAALRATKAGISEIDAALQAMTEADPNSEESLTADLNFHRSILIHSGNDFLAIFAPVIAASLRFALVIQRKTPVSREFFVPRHRTLFEAIKENRVADARDAAQALLDLGEERALDVLKQDQVGSSRTSTE
jgi:DNA-binding FadR family transcriptional regulator